jgi:hypothetical protein
MTGPCASKKSRQGGYTDIIDHREIRIYVLFKQRSKMVPEFYDGTLSIASSYLAVGAIIHEDAENNHRRQA